jgi:hypothetical protein
MALLNEVARFEKEFVPCHRGCVCPATARCSPVIGLRAHWIGVAATSGFTIHWVCRGHAVVMTIASVLAWSAIPIGARAGGLFVDATGDVTSLFLAIGAAMIVVPLAFAFTAVGRATRYEPAAAATTPRRPAHERTEP